MVRIGSSRRDLDWPCAKKATMLPLHSRVPCQQFCPYSPESLVANNNANVVWWVRVLFHVLLALRPDVHTTRTSGEEAS